MCFISTPPCLSHSRHQPFTAGWLGVLVREFLCFPAGYQFFGTVQKCTESNSSKDVAMRFLDKLNQLANVAVQSLEDEENIHGRKETVHWLGHCNKRRNNKLFPSQFYAFSVNHLRFRRVPSFSTECHCCEEESQKIFEFNHHSSACLNKPRVGNFQDLPSVCMVL